jgi:hypothetical protein
MINIITMETVACLRSKCHLKQNLIPSWPWSFWHTSCISDFWCKTKYTNNKLCRTPAYLAVLPVLVIFCPLGPTNFKKSARPYLYYHPLPCHLLCAYFILLYTTVPYLVKSFHGLCVLEFCREQNYGHIRIQ